MYVREYFNESARQSTNEIVKDNCHVFNEMIDQLDWMDDQTRLRAKAKAAVITTHIAYPDKLLDDKKLIDRYENVRRQHHITLYYYKLLMFFYISLSAPHEQSRLFAQRTQFDRFWYGFRIQETAPSSQQQNRLGHSR